MRKLRHEFAIVGSLLVLSLAFLASCGGSSVNPSPKGGRDPVSLTAPTATPNFTPIPTQPLNTPGLCPFGCPPPPNTPTSIPTPTPLPLPTIFIGSNDNYLYALRSDGTLAWRFQTGDWVQTLPAVANGVVYFGSFDRNFYAVRISDGTRLWSFPTRGRVGAVEAGNTGPAVVNGIVYFGSWDSNVYALNMTTGALKWSYLANGAVKSGPTVVGGVVYIGCGNNVCALQADTGTLLWTFQTSNLVTTTPAVQNGVVYAASTNATMYALRAADGIQLCIFSISNWIISSPAVVNGLVYFGTPDSPPNTISTRCGRVIAQLPGGFQLAEQSEAHQQ